MTIKYFLKRLMPFAVIFFAVQTFMRMVLTAYSFGGAGFSAFNFLKIFSVGLYFDTAVFSYFSVPFLLYMLVLPAKYHLGRFDRAVTTIFLFLFCNLVIFTGISEWFFWDEFTTRFNFIAVDYLVYTHEVIGNIIESYPTVPIFVSILLVCGSLTYFCRRIICAQQKPALAFLRRTKWVAVLFILPLLAYLAVNQDQSRISENEIANELAGNGINGLFHAFFNNELDYKHFYVTRNDADVNRDIQKLLDTKTLNFVESTGVTRLVRSAKPEQHKNVIIVVIESFSADYMTTFGNPNHLTPAIDDLSKKSLFFTELYATGTRTVRGLEAVALSVPPTPGQSILRRPGNENMSSIGFVFKDRGYDTKFIYGGHGYFDNMNYFFKHNGFDIVDRNDLADSEVTFSNAWGACDEDLFSRVLVESDKSFAEKKPFMDVVMTTSNHRPYTFPASFDAKDLKGRNAGVHYTDKAIGKFLEKAKTKPWFNDTVFVFVADHTASSAGRVALDPDKYHIPLIIYAPGFIKPQRVDTLASQIDLAPTLLGLLNFSYYSKFYGQDLTDAKNIRPRAFISNYQKMGLLENDTLTILEPQQKSTGPAVDDAVTYYQSASNWKNQLKKFNNTVVVTKAS
jgi:phosphoglycerol transferase MdoB-like AlkP superfamily enzyme